MFEGIQWSGLPVGQLYWPEPWMLLNVNMQPTANGERLFLREIWYSLPHRRSQQVGESTHLICGYRYKCVPRRFIRLLSEVIP